MPAATRLRWRDTTLMRFFSSSRVIAPSLLLLAGAAVMAYAIPRGWYPHDEGALGQSAMRLLGGEWPHRDFDEIYTLLLSAWHALWFALLGPSVVATRIALLVAVLPWLFAMYRLGLRFLTPEWSAGVAFVALLWSVPNYPAGMPSWYLLFCATGAALAVVKWQEDGRRRWIGLAGLLAGVAVLFKLSGLLILAGAGLAVVASIVVDETIAEPSVGAGKTIAEPSGAGLPSWFLALLLFAVTLLLLLLFGRAGGREFTRYCVPLCLVLLALGARALQGSSPIALTRLQPLLLLVAGALVPIAALALLYAGLGALPALVDGVLVAPFKRVAFAAKRPPSPEVLQLAVPMLALLMLPSVRAAWTGPVLRVGAVWFTAVLLLSGAQFNLYRSGWYSAWSLLFVAAIGVAWQLLKSGQALAANAGANTTASTATSTTPSTAAARAVACVAIGLALIEYPFAAPVYVLYSLPLVMLAVVALTRTAGQMHPRVQLLGFSFFFAFGLLRVLPGSVDSLGSYFARTPQTARLTLDHGGIDVLPSDSVQYSTLIPFVRSVAAGRPLWAGPDSPEVYFLAGLPNRTRSLFDFFDANPMTGRPFTERLERLGVAVVVVKQAPPFSPALTPESRQQLETMYPQARRIDGFEVRWR